jgi:ribosomal protein S18 acetylase RimI-like enzyme
MLIIRPLESTDSETRISQLFSQLTGRNDAKVDIKALCESSTKCLVIENNSEIIGFGSLVPYYLPTVGEIGRIEDIIIDENYRGQGLGKKLISEIIKFAREYKILKLQLTSNPQRLAARNLYQDLGFQIKDTDVFVLDLIN